MIPRQQPDPVKADGPQGASVHELMQEGDAVAGLLQRQIQMRTGHRVHDLCVTPVDGHLCVHGRVTSYYLKQLIIAAVMGFCAESGTVAQCDVEVMS
jgi:hypothetical protein